MSNTDATIALATLPDKDPQSAYLPEENAADAAAAAQTAHAPVDSAAEAGGEDEDGETAAALEVSSNAGASDSALDSDKAGLEPPADSEAAATETREAPLAESEDTGDGSEGDPTPRETDEDAAALAAAHAEPSPRALGDGSPLPAAPAVPPRVARFRGPLETPESQPGPHFTVLQPMTPLSEVELVKRPAMPEDERRLLHTWSGAMEQALRDGRPEDAVRLAHPVLRQLPRHLATYDRLIRAAWKMRRWDEGDAWGRRLLRADPASALAWRAVAMAVEQQGERPRACARWQRAFDCDPYEPETRAGLVRTSIDLARLPQLNEAALGSLFLRGFRWEQAVLHYRSLTETDGRRLDYQSNLLLALWQNEQQRDAYDMARRLSQTQPYLLIAWVVIDEAGDDNDRALARHPLSTMDPDGDYVRTAWGLTYPSRSIRLTLTDAEKALIESMMVPTDPA